MARPHKRGLDYYSQDVDMMQDDKVKFVSAIFGLEGEAILRRLLDHTFRDGYYADWGEEKDMLFAIGLPARNKERSKSSIPELTELVREVVDELLKRGFFDKEIYEKYKILTSRGIQRRYLSGTGKRDLVEIDGRFWLLKNEKPCPRGNIRFFNVSDDINGVSVSRNSIYVDGYTQSKVKESKGKKSKVKENKDGLAPSPADVLGLFNEICISLPHVETLTKGRHDALRALLSKYSLDDFQRLFQKAEASSFLKGIKTSWKANFDWLIVESNMTKVFEGNYDESPRSGLIKARHINYTQNGNYDIEALEQAALNNE